MIAELVKLANSLREQASRGEKLGMNSEELAFYDVLARRDGEWAEDPLLRDRPDHRAKPEEPGRPRPRRRLDRAPQPQAKVRLRIRAILRREEFKPILAADGGGLDAVADRIFEQAQTLYQRWPEIEGEDWPT